MLLYYPTGKVLPDLILIGSFLNNTGIKFFLRDSTEPFLFTTTVCNSNCNTCSKQYPSYCMECKQSTDTFMEGGCSSDCGGSFKKRIENDQSICSPCHPSCGICKLFGSSYNRQSCDTCGPGFEKIIPYESNFNDYNNDFQSSTIPICACMTPTFEFRGQCLNKCPGSLQTLNLLAMRVGTLSQAYICGKQCPSNFLPFTRFTEELDLIPAAAFDKNNYQQQGSIRFNDVQNVGSDCPPVPNVAQFQTGSSAFQIIVATAPTTIPNNMTVSFWFKPMASSASVKGVLSALGIIKVDWDPTTGVMTFGLAGIPTRISTVLTPPPIPPSVISTNNWYHFSFSYSLEPEANKGILTLVWLDTSTPVNVFTQTDVTLSSLSGLPTPIPEIILGCDEAGMNNRVFDGELSEVKILKVRIPKQVVPILAYKYEYLYGSENPAVMHYFKLNETISLGATNFYNIVDWGPNYRVSNIIAASAVSFPKTVVHSAPLFPRLCYFAQLMDCKGSYDWQMVRMIPDAVYLGLETTTQKYFDFVNHKGGTKQLISSAAWEWKTGDKIGLFAKSCSGSTYGIKIFTSNFKFPSYMDPEVTWATIDADSFYELCGYSKAYDTWIVLDQIRYTGVSSFSPYNTAIYFSDGSAFTLNLGKSTYSNIGDRLVLSSNCLSLLSEPDLTDPNFITGLKSNDAQFQMAYIFDITKKFTMKSVGKTRFCVVPSYSKNQNRLMVGYSKSTYLVIQNMQVIEQFSILPKPTVGDLYMKSGIFQFDFEASFNMFYNYDYIYFIDCSTKLDANVADFECYSTELGKIDFINTGLNYFYIGPGGAVPLATTSTEYCLCYNGVKTKESGAINPGTELMILRTGPNVAKRFKILQPAAGNLSPNVVAMSPRNPEQSLTNKDFIWFKFDRDIFVSSYASTVFTVSISSYVLDNSCFGMWQV